MIAINMALADESSGEVLRLAGCQIAAADRARTIFAPNESREQALLNEMVYLPACLAVMPNALFAHQRVRWRGGQQRSDPVTPADLIMREAAAHGGGVVRALHKIAAACRCQNA